MSGSSRNGWGGHRRGHVHLPAPPPWRPDDRPLASQSGDEGPLWPILIVLAALIVLLAVDVATRHWWS